MKRLNDILNFQNLYLNKLDKFVPLHQPNYFLGKGLVYLLRLNKILLNLIAYLHNEDFQIKVLRINKINL